tara:strand:- start:1661 stop:2155 length:495 start_codon:yes stop_codon:yes gene_type:complete
MRIKSYNKSSKDQRSKIETECRLVYFGDGIDIGKQLIFSSIGKKVYGLAHNQIGGDKKVFIAKNEYVNGAYNLVNGFLIFINAEIVSHSDDYILAQEGCMSFPDKFVDVKRYNEVIVRHQIKSRNSNDGDAFVEEKFFGLSARIIQHEIDHTNGIHIFNKKEKK